LINTFNPQAQLLFLTDSHHLIHFQIFMGVPSIVLTAGLLIASYLLGWASEPLAQALTRAAQFRAASNDELARKAFTENVPGAAGRPFAQADNYLLLAVAEIHAQDAATEVSRMRAAGLMLRNCSVPFLAACALAVFEAATGHDTPVRAAAPRRQVQHLARWRVIVEERRESGDHLIPVIEELQRATMRHRLEAPPVSSDRQLIPRLPGPPRREQCALLFPNAYQNGRCARPWLPFQGG